MTRGPIQLPNAPEPPNIEALLRACDELPGTLCGVPASAYARALVLVSAAAGLRSADLRNLRWSNIAIGSLSITERKTGNAYMCELDLQTMKALAVIRQAIGTDRVFPGSKASHLRLWRLLARYAGTSARLPHALRTLRLKGGAA